jgi:cobyrinic acid a,c-diamide synthase
VRLPRLLIAAPGSSSGKTMLTLLCAAWARSEGLDVRAFKAGPDFIDAQHLSAATGRPAPCLDPWFLPPAALRSHFARWSEGADLALVEGAMGLYDGKKGAPFGRYSSAHTARSLGLPIVLVLNARKAGPTLATQALGLAAAGPGLRFRGVVLNQCSGAKGAALIAPAVKRLSGLPVLGWLPHLPQLALPERHLGLTAASESPQWGARLRQALPLAARSLDFGALLRAARGAPALAGKPPAAPRPGPGFRLAVARDEAFHFYYPENLALLQDLGAELAWFSPLESRALPAGSQGLLLGGGFPESFAARLASNRPLKAAVRAALARGLPLWAECGGLMWLGRSLRDLSGRAHAMVGALPAETRMERALQHFGYAQAEIPAGAAWPAAGCTLKGHEFHHSRLRAQGRLRARWSILQAGKPPRPEAYAVGGGVATYFHAYLPSAPRAARSFAAACRAARPL